MTKGNDFSMIDMEIMHTVFGKNQTAILDYLKNFVGLTSELLKHAEYAVSRNNKVEAMACFHKLNGSLSGVGFKKMYILCQKAEAKINQSDWVAAKQLCSDMEKILNKFEVELREKIK